MMSLCGKEPRSSQSEFGLLEAAGLRELRGDTCESVKSPLGGASDTSSEEQSARSCRSMVVRAARGEPGTRRRRALSLRQSSPLASRQDIGAPGEKVHLSRACATHPAPGTRGIAREPPGSPGSAAGSASRGSSYIATGLLPLQPGKNFRGEAN